MDEDRRKGLRRERDKELDAKMLAIESTLQEHLKDCAENAKQFTKKLEQYHTQNTRRLDGIEETQSKDHSINKEALEILNAIATGKKATVGVGRFLIWIASVFAAVLGIITGVNWMKSH